MPRGLCVMADLSVVSRYLEAAGVRPSAEAVPKALAGRLADHRCELARLPEALQGYFQCFGVAGGHDPGGACQGWDLPGEVAVLAVGVGSAGPDCGDDDARGVDLEDQSGTHER
jgi:hypothetical protein